MVQNLTEPSILSSWPKLFSLGRNIDLNGISINSLISSTWASHTTCGTAPLLEQQAFDPTPRDLVRIKKELRGRGRV